MAPKLKTYSNVRIANTNQMAGASRASRRGIGEKSLNLPNRENDHETIVLSDDDHVEEIHEEQMERDEAPSIPTRRRVRPFGTHIFTLGLAVRPTNPHYVTKINLEQPDWLFVSNDVFGHTNFVLPERALLVDSEGRKWRTELFISKDGCAIYQGGWNYLCMNNEVQKDDLCIVEFVDRGNAIDIHVDQIVRAVTRPRRIVKRPNYLADYV